VRWRCGGSRRRAGVAAKPQWCQRGRRRCAGPDRLGCLSAVAAPDGSRRVERVTERSGASRSLASLRTRLPTRADRTVVAGERELTGPNSKRVRLEKAGGQTKTYSQNEPLPSH